MHAATKALRRMFTLALANTASSLHFYLLAYITSSYLAHYLPSAQLGLVYSGSAVIMILGFIVLPHVLNRLSVRRVALLLALADLVTLLLLIGGVGATGAILLVALQGALAPLIAYTLDLFLENATVDEGTTGHMRGLFLTAGNIALVSSPILIGLTLGSGNAYGHVFIAAAISLVVFIGIITTRQRFLADEKITRVSSLLETLSGLIRKSEVRSVLIANTFLQSFYIWAPVYVPLYLHQTLGFSWGTLGPIFALMLLPFLLVELPMGFLEDRIRGARLIMASGFVIAGLSLAAFAFVTASTPLLVITIILVLTRLGAALIEITAETSFFRDVGGQDAESVSFFRMTRPVGMLIGPLVGSAFLMFTSLQLLFVPLGLLTLLGIPFALRIKNGSS